MASFISIAVECAKFYISEGSKREEGREQFKISKLPRIVQHSSSTDKIATSALVHVKETINNITEAQVKVFKCIVGVCSFETMREATFIYPSHCLILIKIDFRFFTIDSRAKPTQKADG